MKARRLVVRAEVMGFGVNIATLKIGGTAKSPELKQWTELVCPNDFKKCTYHGSYYECDDCGFKATSWMKLLRVKRGTHSPVKMPKLTKGNGEIEQATIWTMPFEEFSQHVDARDPNEPARFITVEDEESAKNLFKLLVAEEVDKTAIILKWNDTKQQIIALLTTTISGRVIIAPIIPDNLVTIPESLMFDRSQLTEKDIEEGRMFLKQIPKAVEETLCVTDYRVEAVEGEAEKPSEKVEQLAVIMAKAKKAKK